MFQCTACGLLSVRDTSCPGCGGTSFLDLEAEDATSLEGFGEVPGLDEAATALHEIAPPPEQEPVEEEEPEGDLPFGFGGMARAHAPSLPFGFGASSPAWPLCRQTGLRLKPQANLRRPWGLDRHGVDHGVRQRSGCQGRRNHLRNRGFGTGVATCPNRSTRGGC